ncbi:MAG TPA: hypothetical protein VFJ85_10770 [Acidimicrobiales bacterium]|nr:hypothetical protein [Acidimicrobiales bacterium]
MALGFPEARRMALVEAARALARDATSAARESIAFSAEWSFYHGVETAALHVLRPEVSTVREGTAWLDAEEPAFREGFLQGAAVLATAASAAEPPLRLRLPEPPRTPA